MRVNLVRHLKYIYVGVLVETEGSKLVIIIAFHGSISIFEHFDIYVRVMTFFMVKLHLQYLCRKVGSEAASMATTFSKKAIRFRLNCPHLNLFSLLPFSLFSSFSSTT